MKLANGSTLLGWASVLVYASVTIAAPVTTVPNFIVFGNSLSDTGKATDAMDREGYFGGRASNSYMWNEYTAKLLGMNLINLAYGGATTNNDISPALNSDNTTIPSFHDQVVSWINDNPNPSQFHLNNDVIEIEIGGNDILHSVTDLVTGTLDLTKFAAELAKSIATDIQLLAGVGYKNINLWNLPAVDKTPIVTSLNAGQFIKPVVEAINAATKSYVDAVISSNVAQTKGIHIFDLNGLMSLALQPSALAALDVTDSTTACYTEGSDGNPSICSNPDQHFFFDIVHPASRMHYLWGVAAAVLTQDPNATIDINKVISIAENFDIAQSDRQNNIIVDGITPSESEVVPAPSETDDYTTSPTSVPGKCH
ncbi:hypothetical protein LPJ55_003470 [Coemansia sp. RSA 990]|nr:hypothetical protein BX667DRAFT_497873 [Coemansia mojavensis]KAJ1871951.1 hypothetical protein LPJ55_003470 [Coemansia sp. RSA 990]KAJ2672578.1 hypothetical protein IWW42_002732 [Coemansia sp. RSA 1085]